MQRTKSPKTTHLVMKAKAKKKKKKKKKKNLISSFYHALILAITMPFVLFRNLIFQSFLVIKIPLAAL